MKKTAMTRIGTTGSASERRRAGSPVASRPSRAAGAGLPHVFGDQVTLWKGHGPWRACGPFPFRTQCHSTRERTRTRAREAAQHVPQPPSTAATRAPDSAGQGSIEARPRDRPLSRPSWRRTSPPRGPGSIRKRGVCYFFFHLQEAAVALKGASHTQRCEFTSLAVQRRRGAQRRDRAARPERPVHMQWIGWQSPRRWDRLRTPSRSPHRAVEPTYRKMRRDLPPQRLNTCAF